VPNRTISLPDDVIPIIHTLDGPFSQWVADQLRRHAAESTLSFADQLVADAALAANDRRFTAEDARRIGERLDRTAPW
jgi:hypothetical protein